MRDLLLKTAIAPERTPRAARSRARWKWRALFPVGMVALSALLVSLAQILPGLGWLVLPALAPLCLVLRPERFSRTWLTLTLLYATYTMASCYWIHHYRNGSLIALAIPCLLYTGLFFFIPAACCRAMPASGGPFLGLLVLPAGWAITELLARYLFLRVSWALLGQPLIDYPILAQGAALLGPEFLSFLVAATGVALASCLRECPPRLRLLACLQGPGLLLLMLMWGAIRLVEAPGSAPAIRVAVIQPNLTPDQLWDLDNRSFVLGRLDGLIDRVADQRPDLVILPESAMPGFVAYAQDLADWVQRTVGRLDCPLLFGSLDRDGNIYFNIAMLYTPGGEVTVYRKQRLVPVTEYVPDVAGLRDWVAKLRGDRAGFTPGDVQTVFKLPGGTRFGTMICYEDIFPEIARGFTRGGAQFLVSVVNTAEFKDSGMAWQHLRRARLTALAVGSSLVRCSNGGISCQIDRFGQVVDSIKDDQGNELMVQGARVFRVPLRNSELTYRQRGDALSLVVFAGVVVAAGFLSRRGQTGSDTPVAANETIA
jgi:apolipoprotein N-acyltransferase